MQYTRRHDLCRALKLPLSYVCVGLGLGLGKSLKRQRGKGASTRGVCIAFFDCVKVDLGSCNGGRYFR